MKIHKKISQKHPENDIEANLTIFFTYICLSFLNKALSPENIIRILQQFIKKNHVNNFTKDENRFSELHQNFAEVYKGLTEVNNGFSKVNNRCGREDNSISDPQNEKTKAENEFSKYNTNINKEENSKSKVKNTYEKFSRKIHNNLYPFILSFIIDADSYLHYSNGILFRIDRCITAIKLLTYFSQTRNEGAATLIIAIFKSRIQILHIEFSHDVKIFDGVIELYCGVPP